MFDLSSPGDVTSSTGGAVAWQWRGSLRIPTVGQKFVRIVTGVDLAVATSGTYEKGLHVINPHTGQPASELVSVL